MELGDYIKLARIYWVLMLVCILVAVSASLVVVALTPAKYQSTAKAVVSISSTSDASQIYQANSAAASVASNVSAVAKTGSILDRVTANSSPRSSTVIAQSQVSATVEPNSAVVDITVTSGSPIAAAATANGVVTELQSYLRSVSPLARSGSPAVQFILLERADVPPQAATTSSFIVIGVGLFAGVVAALALVVFIDAVRGSRQRRRAGLAPDKLAERARL